MEVAFKICLLRLDQVNTKASKVLYHLSYLEKEHNLTAVMENKLEQPFYPFDKMLTKYLLKLHFTCI